MPESFLNKYRDAISEIFVLASSPSYLFNSQDIVPAINRLGIEAKGYIIISFGIDIQELIVKDGNRIFKEFKIVNFYYRNYHLAGESLFILKIADLPKLNYRELKTEEIKKF